MKPTGKSLTTATLLCAATLSAATVPAGGAAQEPPPAADDEVIVRGRDHSQLTLHVHRAQEAVFARFNDINSDDAHDIHCTMDERGGSHILERRCLSNSWRRQERNFARMWLHAADGTMPGSASQYRAEQLRVQGLVFEEMRRLSHEDPELGEAVLQLGRAMQALQAVTGARPAWTMFRDVPDVEGLPFDAQRVFEVHMGPEPWTHYLTWSTFTLGEVSGTIREIELDCEQGDLEIEYEVDVEWTVPQNWSRCMLRVDAKRGTKFAFFEFE